ncbi:thioredoxin domain-containing protein [Echinicola rosea]|uniref:Thioredoxin n=1 Tax=Echinicola rosea TaxID=1807691 RepID=A0ABQ1V3D9_9BACT|nr:thioredoxin domain-containing protein [Echinicola rosea]GGF36310.1 thioredoxin [Echinicola rosea]
MKEKVGSFGVCLALMVSLLVMACTSKNQKEGHKNDLADALSPYLQQHSDNPIRWNEWSDEVLEKATSSNKLLVISIGYASCHWCHVMEQETFMDTLVAKEMNRDFISVKVDREQRPDIDQVYSKAAVLLNGSTGWPLNIIALPDGRPLVAATYMPKDRWLVLLKKASDLYREQPEALRRQAQNIVEKIIDPNDFQLTNKAKEHTGESSGMSGYASVYPILAQHFDGQFGGVLEQQKFPRVALWGAVLDYAALKSNKNAQKMVEKTLFQMSTGGLYDHVGGGFSRYSTDAQWQIPHFEKMLYDNAQLLGLFSKTYKITKQPLLRDRTLATFDWLREEMKGANGLYHCSMSAVSGQIEGLYYTWTWEELTALMSGEDRELFFSAFDITRDGNWQDGKNVLYRQYTDQELSEMYNLPENKVEKIIKSNLLRLHQRRKERKLPDVDTKQIASWNALLVQGLVEMYLAFGMEESFTEAVSLATTVHEKLQIEDYSLHRLATDKNAAPGNAFLDDYANWIAALIQLYQASLDKKWLDMALATTRYVLAHFDDPGSPLFTYSESNESTLYMSEVPVLDGDMISPNSLMAKNLFLVGTLFGNSKYIERSKAMLDEVTSTGMENIFQKASWWELMALHSEDITEVALLGDKAQDWAVKLQQRYYPNTLFIGGEEENLPLLKHKKVTGKTMIYVCRNKTCKLPVDQLELAVRQLKEP